MLYHPFAMRILDIYEAIKPKINRDFLELSNLQSQLSSSERFAKRSFNLLLKSFCTELLGDLTFQDQIEVNQRKLESNAISQEVFDRKLGDIKAMTPDLQMLCLDLDGQIKDATPDKPNAELRMIVLPSDNFNLLKRGIDHYGICVHLQKRTSPTSSTFELIFSLSITTSGVKSSDNILYIHQPEDLLKTRSTVNNILYGSKRAMSQHNQRMEPVYFAYINEKLAKQIDRLNMQNRMFAINRNLLENFDKLSTKLSNIKKLGDILSTGSCIYDTHMLASNKIDGLLYYDIAAIHGILPYYFAKALNLNFTPLSFIEDESIKITSENLSQKCSFAVM